MTNWLILRLRVIVTKSNLGINDKIDFQFQSGFTSGPLDKGLELVTCIFEYF